MHVGELIRDLELDRDAEREAGRELVVVWTVFLRELATGAPGAWAGDAACKGHQEVMFPERGDSTDPARELCQVCPVASDCSAWAGTVSAAQSGVIAGLSQRQRDRARRELGRG